MALNLFERTKVMLSNGGGGAYKLNKEREVML